MPYKEVGIVHVDSGRLLITDYLEAKEVRRKRTTELLEEANFPLILQLHHNKGHLGAGISIASGFGDGSYKVEADIRQYKGWGTRVKAIRIKFIEE